MECMHKYRCNIGIHCQKYYDSGVPANHIKHRCQWGAKDELKPSEVLEQDLQDKLFECFCLENNIKLLQKAGY